MKILLAGASGAIGRRLVPALVKRGHEVVGTTRTESKVPELWNLGAKPLVLDVLDADAVTAAVKAEQPDAIIHQATALAGLTDLRRFDEAFAQTNRLRTAGTDNLLAAARAGGVQRFVAQSFAGWPYAHTGGPVKGEDDPLDPHPPAAFVNSLAAIRHLEAAVIEFGGTVLRYGGFYGPGTGLDRDGEQLAMVRRRRFPMVGSGAGVWSFVHIDDAAEAAAIAVERGEAGIFNVVDDEPARVRDWLPALADAVGAKPPRHLPAWLARVVAGEHMVAMMESSRGASNAKAKRELGWAPRHASWRDGFREVAA